jgi:hypothetical protein
LSFEAVTNDPVHVSDFGCQLPIIDQSVGHVAVERSESAEAKEAGKEPVSSSFIFQITPALRITNGS